MTRMQRLLFLWAMIFAMILPGPGGVAAHDAVYTGIALDGVFVPYTDEHADLNPFKGAIDVTVTNTGHDAWGDFHFMIFQAQGYGIGNVFFTTEDPAGVDDYTPTSSQSLLDWRIGDNGHSFDLWFYNDPVAPGETARFTVYTDNTTDSIPYFGVGFFATPVPVPGALVLLGSGLLGLLSLRRRRANA